MNVVQFKDINDFSRRSTAMLLQRECENCWHLGLIGSKGPLRDPHLLLGIESNGAIVASAAQNGRDLLCLTHLPDGAAEPLVDKLITIGWSRQSMVGPVPSVDEVVKRWSMHTGKSARPFLELRVFQLTAVVPPASVPGRMVCAMPKQIELMTRWRDEFARSIGEPENDPAKMVRQLLDEQRMFVWEDQGEPRSLACIAGPTPNGMRINSVYTPPKFRGRGYASNLVASLSQSLLNQGRRFCFLFTDQANPTSNAIYQRIGYRAAGDYRNWAFENHAAS